MCDGVVDRWTRDKRKEYADQQEKLMESGVLPTPNGIGLSRVIDREQESA